MGRSSGQVASPDREGHRAESAADPTTLAALIEWLDLVTSENGFPDLLTAPQRTAAARRFSLTKREQRVLRLLCRGLSNDRIAEEMDICRATLRTHLRSISRKLGAGNRLDAILVLIHELRPG